MSNIAEIGNNLAAIADKIKAEGHTSALSETNIQLAIGTARDEINATLAKLSDAIAREFLGRYSALDEIVNGPSSTEPEAEAA